MGRPKLWTKEVIVAELHSLAKKGQVNFREQSGGLRAAVKREFGTWEEACRVAGIKANGRGRPKLK